mmetsp:Transcript_18030/g.54312  ORF Transcript_18030/g.54312 Transcript_18030/m.54312 type:complete len:262 (+) Transcript_18030:839-1624(+)
MLPHIAADASSGSRPKVQGSPAVSSCPRQLSSPCSALMLSNPVSAHTPHSTRTVTGGARRRRRSGGTFSCEKAQCRHPEPQQLPRWIPANCVKTVKPLLGSTYVCLPLRTASRCARSISWTASSFGGTPISRHPSPFRSCGSIPVPDEDACDCCGIRERVCLLSDASHSQGKSDGIIRGCCEMMAESHSRASTSRGPGRLNIASPSTRITRPSLTARSPLHQPAFAARRSASRRTDGRSRPHGHKIIRSGSDATSASGSMG